MIKTGFTGDDEFRRELAKKSDLLTTKKLMRKIALQAITSIIENTVEGGKDKHGKPLKKYSSSYLDKKKKRGGRFFSSQPNLFDSGNMFGNLDHRVVSKSSVFLHFPKTLERLKASGHIKGSRILPKRDFFGLTKLGEKEVLTIADDHLEEVISG